ncbi:MAG: ADP-forming succinate--CoA ligase subunit beta [Gammaproteobacteria bacterium]
MNLHEFQSKALFRQYQLPVSEGITLTRPEEAAAACAQIGGDKWVVKAQIHAGGRGKAGGVKLVSTPQEAEDFAREWLGKHMVTYQTDEHGQPVNTILIETCTDIAQELYLGVVLDRSLQRVIVMASAEGGVEIEQLATEKPELILRQTIDPMCGPLPWQGREMGFQLGLNTQQVKEFAQIFCKLVQIFIDKDLALIEINPMVITEKGHLHCLDAKLEVDPNAAFRQTELEAQRDESQEKATELEAEREGLSYVQLDGNIGCMVNGAGLAMGTMDLIQLSGGSPANFLDVGGRSDADRVAKAFAIILSNDNISAILINIFGGIVRCDQIAKGIIQAINKIEVKVPVVVRLEGNQAEAGRQLLLQNEGLDIIAASSLQSAVEKVVECAK